MPRMWCISCQSERSHKYDSCGGACGGNCEHECETCGRRTLASFKLNTLDTGYAAIKQAIGEAQRRAQQDSNLRGEIEIDMSGGNAFSGSYEKQILVYNTYTGNYRINKF